MKKYLFVLLLIALPVYPQSTKTVFGECEITDYVMYYTIDFTIRSISVYTKTIEVWQNGKKMGEVEPVYTPNYTYRFKVNRL